MAKFALNIRPGRAFGIFSEHVISISSARRTRVVRLAPATVAALIFGSAMLTVWAAGATSIALGLLANQPAQAPESALRARLQDRVESLEAESSRLAELNSAYQARAEDAFELAFEQSVEIAELNKRIIEFERVAAARASASRLPAAVNGTALQAITESAHPEGVHAARHANALYAAVDRNIESLEAARGEIRSLSAENAELQERSLQDRQRAKQAVLEILDTVNGMADDLERFFAAAGVSPASLSAEARNTLTGAGGPGTSYLIETFEDEAGFRSGEDLGGMLVQSLGRLHQYRAAYMGTPFGYPVPTEHRITSVFGKRMHPVTGQWHMHEGVDFGARHGTPVLATGDGIVTFAGWQSGYGKTVSISHLGGISSSYAHLSKIAVQKGQRVSRDERIGDIGSTGLSTGPHLHYEIVVREKPVNPMQFIRAEANVH